MLGVDGGLEAGAVRDGGAVHGGDDVAAGRELWPSTIAEPVAARRPASAAGVPWRTSVTITPAGTPSSSATDSEREATPTPR